MLARPLGTGEVEALPVPGIPAPVAPRHAADGRPGTIPEARMGSNSPAPGGCVPPLSSLAVTPAVTLVSYRAPARPTPTRIATVPCEPGLSTPSPSPPAATCSPTSATTAPSLCSASPARPPRPAGAGARFSAQEIASTLTGTRSADVLLGDALPGLLSQFLSHSPASGAVHRRPPQSCSGRSRTVADACERWPALLESVLGATPQEFESPILRHPDLQEHRPLTVGAGSAS